MWPLSYKKISHIIGAEFSLNHHNKNLNIYGIFSDSRKMSKIVTNYLDSNHLSPDPFLFVAIKGEIFDGHTYLNECFEQGLRCALVDKHSPYLKNLKSEYLDRCFRVENVVTALRKLAKEFRKTFTFPVIAIGGSNGKTTTKEILSSFLTYSDQKITKTQKSENGFLGVAFTLLQESHQQEDPPSALVLEIGIDEVGAMQQHLDIAKPDVALLTALGPEHLTGLKTWQIAVSEELILFSSPSCENIWQLCDEKLREHFLEQSKNSDFLRKISQDTVVTEKSSQHYFNKNILSNLNVIYWELTSISVNDSTIHIQNNEKTLFQGSIPLIGKHNVQNFVLAFASALHLGQTPENILTGFQNYQSPAQRFNFVSLPHNTIMIDDTYNSSPGSMAAALEILQLDEWKTKPKILILGDMLELEDESKFWHENLFKQLEELEDAHLCLFGSAMYNCYRLLKNNRQRTIKLQETRKILDWSDSHHEPTIFLEKLKPHLKGSIILIKGSRGMRLERFVQGVENFFS